MQGWLHSPDLLNPEWLRWFPVIVARIRRFLQAHLDTDPEDTLRRMVMRVLVGDPLARLYIGFDDDELVAWGWATLEQQGPSKWIYCLAGESTVPAYTEMYFVELEKWGRELGATSIIFSSKRSPKAWARRHKFMLRTYSLIRPIQGVTE